MTSAAGRYATPPLRQSCDRCHGQKLRCSGRSGSDTGACTRCLRQGADCVYSTSLAKGRPYQGRSRRATSSTPASTSKTASASKAASISGPTTSLSRSLPAETPIRLVSPNFHTKETVNSWPSLAQRTWNINRPDRSDHDLESMGQSALHAININDLHNQDLPTFLDNFSGLDAHMSNVDLEVGWPVPALAHTNTDSSIHRQLVQPLSPPQSHSHGPGPGHSKPVISDGIYSADVIISQLSQLTTQLHPLHRSSHTLSGSTTFQSQNVPSRPLFDDQAFKAAAAWLLSPNIGQPPALPAPTIATNTAGNILHDAFSAIHDLLQILHRRQLGSLGADAEPPTDIEIDPDINGGLEQDTRTHLADRLGWERGIGGQYSNTVIRHLVIACHTLILDICSALLLALQQDANLLPLSPLSSTSSYASPRYYARDRGGDIEANDLADTSGVDAAPDVVLGDMRLVMVVQLSSYLIDRLCNAVDSYLSSQIDADAPSSSSASRPTSSTSNRGADGDLQVEIQERLEQLRQTLRM